MEKSRENLLFFSLLGLLIVIMIVFAACDAPTPPSPSGEAREPQRGRDETLIFDGKRMPAGWSQASDPDVVKLEDTQWWMFFTSIQQPGGKLMILAAYLPPGDGLEAAPSQWSILRMNDQVLPVIPTGFSPDAWDRDAIEAASYVEGFDPTLGRTVKRIYYTGWRKEAKGAREYHIGFVQWDGSTWVKHPTPVLTGTHPWERMQGHSLVGDQAVFYEPGPGNQPGTWHLWYNANSDTAVVIGAANALNSYLERDIDGLMLRTRHRPLPAGRIAPSVALVAALVASILALPTLAWAANGLTAVLGATALVVYVAIYTPAKRSTSWALLIGAVPGAIPPLMGYTAVTGAVDTGGLVLFGVLFFWQLPHFLAISLYLREDYARAGIRTVSLVHGEVVTQRLIAASAVLLLAMTLLPWPLGLGGMLYGVLALLIGGPLALWAALGLRRPLTPAWSRSFSRKAESRSSNW